MYFVTIGDRHVPGLKIVSVFDDGDPNFRRSDHAPFWDIGVDALMISDGANFRTLITTRSVIPLKRLISSL